jgi:hypothetical protein
VSLLNKQYIRFFLFLNSQFWVNILNLNCVLCLAFTWYVDCVGIDCNFNLCCRFTVRLLTSVCLLACLDSQFGPELAGLNRKSFRINYLILTPNWQHGHVLCTKPTIPAVGSTQPSVQWLLEFFPGVKAAGTWSWRPNHLVARWLTSATVYQFLLCLYYKELKETFYIMKEEYIHLTFMGPCIVIIFCYINPNKMHMLHSLFYLTTALHVSGVTITHFQEHKQL